MGDNLPNTKGNYSVSSEASHTFSRFSPCLQGFTLLFVIFDGLHFYYIDNSFTISYSISTFEHLMTINFKICLCFILLKLGVSNSLLSCSFKCLSGPS